MRKPWPESKYLIVIPAGNARAGIQVQALNSSHIFATTNTPSPKYISMGNFIVRGLPDIGSALAYPVYTAVAPNPLDHSFLDAGFLIFLLMPQLLPNPLDQFTFSQKL